MQNQGYKDHPERFKDSLPEDDSEHSPKLKKSRRGLARSASNAGRNYKSNLQIQYIIIASV